MSSVEWGEHTADAIVAALPTQRLGRKVLAFASVGSTNDIAMEQGARGAPDGLHVLADEQTAGRGRHAHSWWAPAGSSLLMSLLLRPPIPAREAGRLTMCLGLGATEGIEEFTGLRPALKWPNDLLLDGRKLGGMLAELSLRGDGIDYAVLGLGLNVNVDFADAPPDVRSVAVSLSGVQGSPIDRLGLLAAILARYEWWYFRVLGGDSPAEAWAARLDTIGKRVRVTLEDGAGMEAVEGVATGVSPGGALLVRDASGRTHELWAGDVVSLRDPSLREAR